MRGRTPRWPSAPRCSGHMRSAVLHPCIELQQRSKSVEVTSSPYPESALTPQLLSSTYVLEALAPQLLVSNPYQCHTTGGEYRQAVWLAVPQTIEGIRLAWRSFQGEEKTPLQEGREGLRYDVSAEQSYRSSHDYCTIGTWRLSLRSWACQ